MRISDWSSDVCSSDLRRAVLFALARAGVGSVTILNRSPLKAAGLLATFGLKGEAVGLDSPLPPAALLVNASSLGMAGQPPLALDLTPLADDAIVYDLVYAPLTTGLLATAEARGLGTVDGLDLLIGQRSEEHTSELQSLMRISYALF